MQNSRKAIIKLSGAGYGPSWGWDPPSGKPIYNVGLFAFMLAGKERLVPSEDYLIFHNNWESPDGAVSLDYIGYDKDSDLTRGILEVDFSKIAQCISEIVIVVHIGEDDIFFGEEPNSTISIYDPHTNQEMHSSKIGLNFSSERCIVFGRLCKSADSWSFEPLEETGFEFKMLCNKFGIQVQED